MGIFGVNPSSRSHPAIESLDEPERLAVALGYRGRSQTSLTQLEVEPVEETGSAAPYLTPLLSPPYTHLMKTTVTSKGQITIPAPLRKKFDLRPGTVLEFDEKATVLTARRVVSRQRMARAAGVLERELGGKSTREWLTDLRGKPDLPERDDSG